MEEWKQTVGKNKCMGIQDKQYDDVWTITHRFKKEQ